MQENHRGVKQPNAYTQCTAAAWLNPDGQIDLRRADFFFVPNLPLSRDQISTIESVGGQCGSEDALCLLIGCDPEAVLIEIAVVVEGACVRSTYMVAQVVTEWCGSCRRMFAEFSPRN